MRRGYAVIGRWAILAGAMLLVGCSKTPAQPAPDVPNIRVVRIGVESQAPEIVATGSVAARREIPLGFTTAGQIASLLVNEGDRVKKGQLLAALNQDQVDSALVSAEAENRRARAEFDRANQLRASGWITQARLDTARAAYDAAKANVRARQFAATTSRIYAPDAGLVLARLAEPQEVVAAGTPIVVLGSEAGGFVLRVPLSDRQSARIAKGAVAQVTLDAWATPFTGRVIEIGGRSDRATGAFQVEISLPDTPGLRSGLIGRARIAALPASGPTVGAPLNVPANALYQARAGEGFVFVIDALSLIHI